VPIPPPPNPSNSLTVTAEQLISAALQELGTVAPGEPLGMEDAPWVLQKLQRVIDTFNARRPMIYANTFTSFPITVNVPQTIGPTGIWQVNQRPVEIPSIGLQLANTTPNTVEIKLNKRDKDWWANQRVKTLTSAIPTDYYYEQDWPNGTVYLWPVPNAQNNCLVQQRTILAEITFYEQEFSLPPGYWDAVVYCLAVACGPSYGVPVSQDLRSLMTAALKAVQANNNPSPTGDTGDIGMPGIGVGGNFNYYSGGPNQ
jgi:hypothetical protein